MSLPQEESRIDRRTAILDAAEEQFAAYGYDGVTLRAIAKKAGVDLALPNYYFGPKRDLFDAVLMRRAEILNAARLAQLDECIASSNGTPSVENIIRAFLRPLERGPRIAPLLATLAIAVILDETVQLVWSPDTKPFPSPLASTTWQLGNASINRLLFNGEDFTLGHRGMKDDPLYKIRTILRSGSENLTLRQQHRLAEAIAADQRHEEVHVAWQAPNASATSTTPPTRPPAGRWPRRSSPASPVARSPRSPGSAAP